MPGFKRCLIATVLLLTAVPAVADARPVTSGGLRDLPAVQPAMTCEDVPKLDLDGVTDAKVTIHSATVVTTGTPAPYCEVKGTVAPANSVVVRLPVAGWTQRYVQTGCGGLCGSANIDYGPASTCPPVVDGTLASATTDMGHQGQDDGSWALGNPQAQIDFAYRGVHVTAQVAKVLISRFYGRGPAYSYFTGEQPGEVVASNATRSRPVHPYPTVARYDGTGSIDDAANFVPVTPRTEPGPGYHWAGERLYSGDYQTSCRTVDGELGCRPAKTWLTALGSGT
jgi:hypothetical protein